MNELAHRYDIPKKELARGRNLAIGAAAAPVLMGGVPFALFLVLMFIFGSTPPAAASLLFLGVVLGAAGLVLGLIISAVLMYRRSNWTREMRERIAADGIKAEEIDWFRHELKPQEKRALKQVERVDLLLADAYRETLASRLTATRIVKTTRQEMSMAQRRKNKLRSLKSENAAEFIARADEDTQKLAEINEEAKLMLIEAESRLQMIESAALRGGHFADSELALKKLSARTSQLPLALEAARINDDIRREIESEEAKTEDGARKQIEPGEIP